MSDDMQMYETVERTPEEIIEYLKEQLRQARVDQNRYRRVKRFAKNQKLMIASKDGFTLVEDLDEYLRDFVITPVTRQEIIQEGLQQLEQAFDEGYIKNYTGPKVTP
jgi:hypothetical protein